MSLLSSVKLFDHELAHEQLDELEQPLISVKSSFASSRNNGTDEKEDDYRSMSLQSKTILLVIGSILGMIFSFGGSLVMISQTSLQLGVFEYSLLWSLTTCVASFAVFTLGYKLCGGDGYLYQAEHFFALGVFVGFCLVSTVMDVLYGMHWASIVLVLIVALFWVMTVTKCAASEFKANKAKKIVQHEILIV